jgi:hypothetical protein
MSDITYTKHGDKRVNNPSMEQGGFLVEEELKPFGMRYPRDPGLDPQLCGRGTMSKDAEDGENGEILARIGADCAVQ